METELVKLPEEIEQLALSISEKKRNEVKKVLNDVFEGTSDWKNQVDNIKVKDINDVMSIQLADVARKNSKIARLNAEKIFDLKRSEVQAQMQSYKTEDALWLKAKQMMQILFKDIEESAKYKADFVKRHESEQLKLRNDLRYEKLLKFISDEEISILEINVMSDETFTIYLSGIEKVYKDKIDVEKKAEKERIEKEKRQKLHNKRKETILPYWQFIPNEHKNTDFGSLTEKEWEERINWTIEEKKKYDIGQKKIAKENERLKKEAIERERLEKIAEAERKEEADKRTQAEKERLEKAEAEQLLKKERNNELIPYIIFIRDYNKMLNLGEKDYQKELKGIKIGAKEHYEYKAKEALRKENERIAKETELQKERVAKAKIEAELKAKADAEKKENEYKLQKGREGLLKIQKELEAKLEAERKDIEESAKEKEAKIAKEKAALLAPDKVKLIELSNTISNLQFPDVTSYEANEVLLNVQNLLTKTSNYIKEKSEFL